MQRLIRFARSPGQDTFAAIPFAGTVSLGLSRRLIVDLPREELADPATWVLTAPHFRAQIGPFSALELLAGKGSRFPPDAPDPRGALAVKVGPHPHCASPPIRAPSRLTDLRRISVQPSNIDTCIYWWTVDAYVDANGRILGVTLDLWEP